MKIQVVLGLGRCSNAQVLIDGDQYVTCMTGNPYFAAPAVTEAVTASKTDITNLRAAINAPVSSTKTDNVRMARDTLDRSLGVLRAKVEEVANDPSIPDAKRIAIVHSAGMDTKSQTRPSRHRFTVSNTENSGVVHLTAQGCANAHDWEYTEDVINFTGRISVHPTTVAHTDIPNLKKVTEYAFFHKAIEPGKRNEWEGPIILIVM